MCLKRYAGLQYKVENVKEGRLDMVSKWLLNKTLSDLGWFFLISHTVIDGRVIVGSLSTHLICHFQSNERCEINIFRPIISSGADRRHFSRRNF